MSKPLTINLQINVYPDGTVSVSNGADNSAPVSSPDVRTAAIQAQQSLPSGTTGDKTTGPESPESPKSPSASSAAPSGPSESDVRTALLAAVKASDKATAVGVLESIAGVSRVPEVAEEKRAEVIAALNAIVAAKAE